MDNKPFVWMFLGFIFGLAWGAILFQVIWQLGYVQPIFFFK